MRRLDRVTAVRPALVVVGLCLMATLPGCRIIKTGTPPPAAAGGGTAQTPEARAEALWQPKIVPYAQAKAAPFDTVSAQAAQSPDAAIRAHGYRPTGPDGKPTLFATVDGTIVDVNTESRAGTIDVDVNNDGKADVQIQIGPVIRGSALRDSLDFTPFESFSNQIDYADFSKALNGHVRDQVLKGLPRDQLKGRHISALVVFFADPDKPVKLATPITFSLGEAK